MNNQEKQTFAKKSLTQALLKLLKEKSLQDITISELARESQISRVSFYRNYPTMEAILEERIHQLLHEWNQENQAAFETDLRENGRNDLQLASLFGHIKEQEDFYTLLFERDLLQLMIPQLKIVLIPSETSDHFAAYLEAFSLYGIYGWIQEWIKRGMTESADELEQWLRMREI
ncbi:TetR/AcrR family transcriptional regulator [Streptococcus ferus]|uniref:TetR family transcriptional regulator n=1 Tax=Streptococcus ferus TaxID=1345 RepID=A0A2X3VYD9_9STRE|nr:TetR/AcrR family transcriptional regulator [Streptococcus ferus]SQF40169.1 TetR family transcriptional regulator [Streptococcus ferus]